MEQIKESPLTGLEASGPSPFPAGWRTAREHHIGPGEEPNQHDGLRLS